MDRRFDVCMLIFTCFCACVNACVYDTAGGCLSLVVYYGFGGNLGTYLITRKGGWSLFTPDADRLIIC